MADINFPIKYPDVLRDESIVDNYFGVSVVDPYRWLEDPEAKETKNFIERQNVITKKFLNSKYIFYLLYC